MPTVSLIAAVSANRAIGRGGDLLFVVPADMAHFKRETMGKPVLMGRKTYESIPARFRPLVGRRNLVLTRDPAWQAEGVDVVRSLEDALALVGDGELMVAGGGEIYALAMPLADRLLLTEFGEDRDGDVFFPAFDPAEWQAMRREAVPEISAEWVWYERIKN